MPFGVADGPSHYTGLINKIFSGVEGVKVYIDDMLIHSENVVAHMECLKKVFDLLIKYNMKISLKKCNFIVKSLKFLGVIIDSKGIKPDPAKLEALKNIKVPTTSRGVCGFNSSIAFHQQFIFNRAGLMKNLYKIAGASTNKYRLTPNEIELVKVEMGKVFEALAHVMGNTFPGIHDIMHVFTDASDDGMAAVIGFFNNCNRYEVVDLFSRGFSDCEKKYSVFRKETLAVLQSFIYWDNILRQKMFVLHTDNKGLSYALSGVVNKTEQRWISSICEYAFTAVHVPGVDNGLADILSRNALKPSDRILKLTKDMVTDDDGIVSVLVEPDDAKKEDLVKEAHETYHTGYLPMVERIIEAGYNWKDLVIDCKDFTAKCRACQRYKPAKRVFHHPLSIKATTPFAHVVMDLAGPLVAFTGYTVFEPLKSKSHDEVIDRLARIWCEYGCPKVISSDGGGEFKNKVLQEIIRKLLITYRFSAAYIPRINGKAENRVNQFKLALIKLLAKNSEQAHKCWPSFIKYIQIMLNTNKSKTFPYSPFYLLYGRVADGLMGHVFEHFPMIKFNLADWFQQQNNVWNEIYKQVDENRQKNYEQTAKAFTKSHIIEEKALEVGTKVMVKNMKLFTKLWEERWFGPYVVDSITDRKSYFLKANDDADAKVFDRKFTRDQLKRVHPDLAFGDAEVIIAISDAKVDEDDYFGSDTKLFLVEYLDVEMDSAWVSSDLIPDPITPGDTDREEIWIID